MDEDEERRKSAKALEDIVQKAYEELVSNGVDFDEMKKEIFEDIEIYHAEKAAEKATKH